MIRALVREARPKQWAKNLLVLAAPAAAKVLTHGPQLWRSLLALVAFCLAASGTYFWNDVLDVEADRRHATKRRRPIAAGEIGLPLARAVGTVLLVAGLAVGLVVRWQLALVVAGYVVLTLAYSTFCKHVAVVDLVMVASGFILRAIGGAVAVDVPMSNWFVLCTSFGSLFVVTGKRYAELRELGDGAAEHRVTLEEYTLTFLQTVLGVAISATLVTYCIWALETQHTSASSWPWYALSIVPVVVGVLRYTLVLEQGHGSAPEEIFFADRALQVAGVVWAALFALGVYG